MQGPIDWQLMYIGSRQGMEVKIMPETGIRTAFIPSGKFRRYLSWRNLLSPFELLAGIWQAIRLIRSFRPQVLFSTGGHVSVPVVLAARWCRIPIVIHEQTLVPGLANRLAARYARRILLSYPQTVSHFERGKCVVTGNPVRTLILSGSREKGRQLLELTERLPVVLVMGGAQGAHFLNMQVIGQLSAWLDVCQLILITGDNADHAAAQEAKKQLTPEERSRFRLFSYVTGELGDLYAASDLVIARAGAGTIAELIALAKPSLLVPLPLSAKQEQQRNAELLERNGGACVFYEAADQEQDLLSVSRLLISDREKIEAMALALRSLQQEGAVEKIMHEINGVLS